MLELPDSEDYMRFYAVLYRLSIITDYISDES